MKIIDNVVLDEENIEFNRAVECISETSSTIFLTGKAGTGKTTFLKHIKNTTRKKTVILAPTGVAAIHAGGQTIHSFFQIKPSVYPLKDKRLRQKSPLDDEDKSTFFDHFRMSKEKLEIIRNMELLIIDEVSMVRCDLLDVIDKILQIRRKNIGVPWGGVQVMLIGDPFQLPPIAQESEWEILKPFYNNEYFFSAKVFEESKLIYIELKKMYRQTEFEFINLLNNVRVNNINHSDLDYLNQRVVAVENYEPQKNEIILTTHNFNADQTNISRLNRLQAPEYEFKAVIDGNFYEKDFPTSSNLKLKVGSQVMFLKNDPGKKYYNGKIGVVHSLDENSIFVEINENTKIEVFQHRWEHIKYEWDEENHSIKETVIGSFIQFPLRLAWAITVHKSQGLTFENVYADLAGAFAPGQVYVALSRCTSFNGLRLKSIIPKNAIKTDASVIEFSRKEIPETLLVEAINQGKANKLYAESWSEIKHGEFEEGFELFIRAIQYRNDLKTIAFKKLILIHLKKNQRNKKQALKYQELYKNQITLLEKVKLDNINLQDYISKLKNEKTKIENELLKQNSELEFYKNRKWYQVLLNND